MRALLIVLAWLVAPGTLIGVALSTGSLWATEVAPRLATLSVDDVRSPTLYRDAERLFNRHFPLRRIFLESKAWVDFYIFRSSPVPAVHIGPAGWLTYRHELLDFQKDGCGDAEAMRDLARHLHELEKIVEASGRTFAVLVAPNKSTIYPERVGLSRSPTCRTSAYELLLSAFREHPVENFVRLDELLLDEKRRTQIYYKTDTHWNDEGALIVARALLQHLAPTTWDRYLGEVTMTSVRYSGDLARMMGLSVSEVAPRLRTDFGARSSPEVRLADAGNIRYTSIEPGASAKNVVLPRAVFYHDSFMTAPLAVIGGAFERIDAYWVDESPRIQIGVAGSEEALRASEIVVFEAVERTLVKLAVDVRAFAEVLGD